MKIIGHRGARGLAPENTIASLAKARENQVDLVEFDVRITKDKVPVLSHGAFINKKDLGRISDVTYKQAKSYKKDITTLSEALDLLGGGSKVYIEVKPVDDVKPIINELKGRLFKGWPAKNIYVASFDQKILKKLHQEMPQVGVIINEEWSGVRARIRARKLNTKVISMDQRWLWPGFIKAMHHRGYTLYSYTINDPAKAKRWAKYGLAGVITDYPDRFRSTE